MNTENTASTVFMEEMDAFTYRDAVAAGRPVIVPVGSIEQHGPHMPLNTDVMLSRAMGGELARRVGGVVAAPIVYGYKSQQRSGGGNHLGGTTSLNGSTVIDIARTLVSEFARHGVHKIVVLNGHFENYQFLYEGVELATQSVNSQGGNIEVMLLSYWDFIDEATITEIYGDSFPGWDVEHGGVLETSLMMKLHPSLVQANRIVDQEPADLPPYDILPVRPERTPSSGCLSSASLATAEIGALLLERAADAMATAVKSDLLV